MRLLLFEIKSLHSYYRKHLHHRSAILENIRWTQTVYRMLFCVSRQNRVRSLRLADILQNGATVMEMFPVIAMQRFDFKQQQWDNETNCWIKSLFLFSLRTKSILIAS